MRIIAQRAGVDDVGVVAVRGELLLRHAQLRRPTLRLCGFPLVLNLLPGGALASWADGLVSKNLSAPVSASSIARNSCARSIAKLGGGKILSLLKPRAVLREKSAFHTSNSQVDRAHAPDRCDNLDDLVAAAADLVVHATMPDPDPPEPLSATLTRALHRHPTLLAALLAYAAFRAHTRDATSTPGPWVRQPCLQPSPTPHLNTDTPQGPRWLAKLLAWWFSQLMHVCGARCTVDVATPPDAARRHMVVWHPHGAYTCMALMHCGRHTVNGLPLRWYPGVAPVLFATPGFREALLLLNARSVDGRTMESLAAAGLTLGVQPGGIPEQLISDSSREVAVFSERAGFVRLAMKHGTALLPAYIFGENQACAARRTAAAAPATSAHH